MEKVELRQDQIECVAACLKYALQEAHGLSTMHVEGLCRRELIRQLGEIIPIFNSYIKVA